LKGRRRKLKEYELKNGKNEEKPKRNVKGL